MKLGTIIKLLRTADEIPQSVLAKKINVTRAYLSQIENNKREPSLAFLKNVAEFFAIPIALLLIGENNPNSVVFKELNNILSELYM